MSGSSGGGSSGEVSWPQWISELHETGANAMLVATTAALNPFVGVTTYDPDNILTQMTGEITAFGGHIDAFDPADDWADMIDTVLLKYDEALVDDSSIADQVAAYSAILDDDLENKTLPRFRAGMRDVNAVQSTAFVVGQSLLEAFKGREVAKYAADLHGEIAKKKPELIINTAGKLLEPQLATLEMRKALAQMSIDTNRIHIVAKKEEVDGQMEIDEAEAKYDYEKWNSFGNYIAGMSGGVGSTAGRQPSTAQSAIGGALSGAAAGGSIGGWWGAAAGGLLGLGSSLMNR